MTFLYKFKQGVASDSYGLHCAKAAGLPKALIDRSVASSLHPFRLATWACGTDAALDGVPAPPRSEASSRQLESTRCGISILPPTEQLKLETCEAVSGSDAHGVPLPAGAPAVAVQVGGAPRLRLQPLSLEPC